MECTGEFHLPWPGTGKSWYRVTDTCNWAEGTSELRSRLLIHIAYENATPPRLH
ncbi:MAG TPA: hypothetical protein VGC21_14890 [Telluria sp.]